LFCSYKLLSGVNTFFWHKFNINFDQFIAIFVCDIFLGLFEGLATAPGTPPLLLPFIRSLESLRQGLLHTAGSVLETDVYQELLQLLLIRSSLYSLPCLIPAAWRSYAELL